MQLPSIFSIQRNVHIKNSLGIDTDLHFVQVSGQESGERIGIFILLPDSSILVCEIQCSNYTFPKKTVSKCLKHQKNTCCIWQHTLIGPVLPLFLSSSVQLDTWDNL